MTSYMSLDLRDSGTSIRFFWPYNSWSNGFLCRWIPEGWRKHGDVGKRQQKQTGLSLILHSWLVFTCIWSTYILPFCFWIIKSFSNTFWAHKENFFFTVVGIYCKFKFIHFLQENFKSIFLSLCLSQCLKKSFFQFVSFIWKFCVLSV